MRRFTDTIVAPFTGPGPAAVTGYRISGPDAWFIGATLANNHPTEPEPMRAYVQTLTTGELGVLIFYPEGKSYTGDQTVELFAHGSPASQQLILAAATQNGARTAKPGEFTERAFINGRLELTQAEAVAEIISADSPEFFALARDSHQGRLRTQVSELREAWLDLLAKVEASTDFSEEIGDFDYEAAAQKIQEVKPILAHLIADADRSEIIRRGFRIAIVGRPNVGKSSLLNALIKRDRAIVTNIAGTTRDTLEESIEIRGRKAVLIDTAGLRETTDVVELLGIERTRLEIAGADLTILLFDLETGWTDDDQRFARQFRDALIVGNKIDLAKPNSEVALGISAAHGLGLEPLIDVIEQKMIAATPKTLVNERHSALLQTFAENVSELENALTVLVPSDLLSTLLREGIHILGQISGETASPNMIDEIFRRFCIGK